MMDDYILIESTARPCINCVDATETQERVQRWVCGIGCQRADVTRGADTPALVDAVLRGILDAWGREYALGTGRENLGYPSKNSLYDLIKFQGKIPISGRAPTPENTIADRVEKCVYDLFKINPRASVALRLAYCGRGVAAQKVEDAGRVLQKKMSLASFKIAVNMGEMYVAGRILG